MTYIDKNYLAKWKKMLYDLSTKTFKLQVYEISGGHYIQFRNEECSMASMKEISELCGVSIATVSKALNGHKDIGEDTRERIQNIILTKYEQTLNEELVEE